MEFTQRPSLYEEKDGIELLTDENYHEKVKQGGAGA
jgi:hypothetical protein